MKPIILIFLITFFIVACQSGMKSEATSWAQKMQSLKNSVASLIPFIYSRSEFSNLANEEKILDNMRIMSENAHKISDKQVKDMLGKDPIAITYANQLQADVDRAYAVFQEGHKEYARTLLRETVGYCFKCHSRSDIGPEFKFVQKTFNDPKLSRSVKADLYVATRQYDEALKLYKQEIFRDKDFRRHIFSFEKAVEKYLSIMVRVKKDPLEAYRTMNALEKLTEVPEYMQENIRSWKYALYSWSKEKTKNSYSLNDTVKLYKNAKKKQANSTFKGANIEYLRLTSMLHDLLLTEESNQKRAEIYEMLGKSYDVLADFGFWEAPEIYYEACVQEWPKSKIAKRCFHDFEQVIHLGYTGSGGSFLPKVERDRIDKLRKIAY